MTLTATITPAANGGTVAFDDGAGNPATTQLRGAARHRWHGDVHGHLRDRSGRHPVTATYSGDGEKNNYIGSTSPTWP